MRHRIAAVSGAPFIGPPLVSLKSFGSGPDVAISGGIGFTPKSIAGLVLWLRADLGITLNGSTVSAWADQSGQGNNVTQGTAADQPAYTSGSAGVAKLDFSGGAGVQLKGGSLSLTQPFEYFVVCGSKTASPAGNSYVIDFNAGNVCAAFQVAAAQSVALYDGAAACTTAFPTAGADFVMDAIFNGAASSLAINGGTPTTGNPGSTSPTAGAVSIGNYIGGNFNFDGWIKEIAVYSAPLTASARGQLTSYLRNLYGVG